MALVLHHLNASRSQRIVWLLEELGTDYDLVSYARNAETHLAPPELLKFHPMGKSPLLETDEGIIAETGAIAEYLMARFDQERRLHPKSSSTDFPIYLEWLHSAEGAPFLPNLLSFYFQGAGLTETPLAQAMKAEQKKAANHIEKHLAAHPFFGGSQFSAADCLMGFNIQNAEMAGVLKERPASQAWLDKMRARPAYQKMLAIGI